jgi:hypothetical protein
MGTTDAHEVRRIILSINSPQMNQADVSQAAAMVQQNIVANSSVIVHEIPPAAPVLPVAAVAPSKSERLQELAMMLENGIITQEEYASGRCAIIRS